MKPKVLVTRQVFPEIVDALRGRFEVEHNDDDRPWPAEELARRAARQLLHDPQCRLLTLVGPGGIGKARLAIETASHAQDAFANGVYFVPLASSIPPVLSCR